MYLQQVMRQRAVRNDDGSGAYDEERDIECVAALLTTADGDAATGCVVVHNWRFYVDAADDGDAASAAFDDDDVLLRLTCAVRNVVDLTATAAAAANPVRPYLMFYRRLRDTDVAVSGSGDRWALAYGTELLPGISAGATIGDRYGGGAGSVVRALPCVGEYDAIFSPLEKFLAAPNDLDTRLLVQCCGWKDGDGNAADNSGVGGVGGGGGGGNGKKGGKGKGKGKGKGGADKDADEEKGQPLLFGELRTTVATIMDVANAPSGVDVPRFLLKHRYVVQCDCSILLL
jgi:hypothetical protein